MGTVDLPAAVFGAQWNATLVKQVLDAQLANRRDARGRIRKDRSEVRGGGKKPWRQKGTGRARHGSTRSPIWVGGGKAHGPRNDKDYSQKVNKKMKRVALFCRAFEESERWRGESLRYACARQRRRRKCSRRRLNNILDDEEGAKRYDVCSLLRMQVRRTRILFRASSNLQKAKAIDAASLNIYDIMNHKNLFLDKEAVAAIEKHYKSHNYSMAHHFLSKNPG